jgi:hypothetical protein
MKKYFFLYILCFVPGIWIMAQPAEANKMKEFTRQNEGNVINEFTSFLSIPNVAVDPVNLARNAGFIMEMMRKRGIQNIQLMHASTAGVPAAVYGEVLKSTGFPCN